MFVLATFAFCLLIQRKEKVLFGALSLFRLVLYVGELSLVLANLSQLLSSNIVCQKSKDMAIVTSSSITA